MHRDSVAHDLLDITMKLEARNYKKDTKLEVPMILGQTYKGVKENKSVQEPFKFINPKKKTKIYDLPELPEATVEERRKRREQNDDIENY